jgi:hypothetical protein
VELTNAQFELLFGLMILAAVLVAGTGRALNLALPRTEGLKPTTQRVRYISLLAAACISAIPVVLCLMLFGPAQAIPGILAFIDVNPVFGYAAAIVLSIHTLTVVLLPVLALYIYARPSRFAHVVYVWEMREFRPYYVETSDIRGNVEHPAAWDMRLRRAGTLSCELT